MEDFENWVSRKEIQEIKKQTGEITFEVTADKSETRKEREREMPAQKQTDSMHVYVCTYVRVYIYTWRRA